MYTFYRTLGESQVHGLASVWLLMLVALVVVTAAGVAVARSRR